MSRYRANKQLELLLVGATWILVFSGYWPDAINFITCIIFNAVIDHTLYLALATAFVAPIHVMWMRVITELLWKERQEKLMKFFWIEWLIYEIILLVLFLVNPSFVGVVTGPFVAEFSYFVMVYFLFSLTLFIITGIMFARFYLKSTNKENRQKGYFLITAFISFLVGTAFDIIIIPRTEFSVAIARVFQMTAALLFYLGFTLRQHENVEIKEGSKEKKKKGSKVYYPESPREGT
ncbi:MAG: hypothetical protein RBG13Loki_2979 [Promethearchaeota archaeon CR_4]|nr:MAG: hypothetical protein RBG13Loki_2979 [Candidatus Lokiarchaeota archaeon CR_4]